MDIKVLNSLYIACFWKFVTSEMLEEILDYDVESMSIYILEMGKFFYETKVLGSGKPNIENQYTKVIIS